ncbi:MAG: hypothetical protein ACJ786_13375 [Catenulispora sp.]
MTVAEGYRFPDRTFTVDPVRVEEFVLALGVEPEAGWAPRAGAPVPLGFFMYVTTYGADAIHDVLGLDMLRTGVLKRWAYVSCFGICLPGQEESAYGRLKALITASVPQFQSVSSPARLAYKK